MELDQEELKELLLEVGLLRRADLEVIEKQVTPQISFEQVLLNNKIVHEDDLLSLKSKLAGISYSNSVPKDVSLETFLTLPEPIARKYGAVVVGLKGKIADVVLFNLSSINPVSKILSDKGIKVAVKTTSRDKVYFLLKHYQSSLKNYLVGELELSEKKQNSLVKEGKKETNQIKKMVDNLLTKAELCQSSEIIIETFEENVTVRERIGGVLFETLLLSHLAGKALIDEVKVRAKVKPDSGRELGVSSGFEFDYFGQKKSVSASILKTFFGERVVLRLKPMVFGGLSTEELGLSTIEQEIIYRNMFKPGKIFVIASSKKQGKTELYYSLLSIIASNNKTSVSFEQAIEKIMPFVSQVKTSSDAQAVLGLRIALKQGVDCLAIDQVNSAGIFNFAINAAERQSNVIVTIEADNAFEALKKVISWVGKKKVSDLVSCIVARSLVPLYKTGYKLESLSKQQEAIIRKLANLEVVAEIASVIKNKQIQPNKLTFLRNNNSNQKVGTTGLHQVLEISSSVAQAINSASSSVEIESAAKNNKVLSLIENGLVKSVCGTVSLDDCLALEKQTIKNEK